MKFPLSTVIHSSAYFAELQPYFHNNRLDFFETEPSVPVVIIPTVPVSCPPCSVTVSLDKLIGLTVSKCSVTFYTIDQPRASRTIYIRAVPTAGGDPRITQLHFRPATTKVSGTGWDGYNIANIPVSIGHEKKY